MRNSIFANVLMHRLLLMHRLQFDLSNCVCYNGSICYFNRTMAARPQNDFHRLSNKQSINAISCAPQLRFWFRWNWHNAIFGSICQIMGSLSTALRKSYYMHISVLFSVWVFRTVVLFIAVLLQKPFRCDTPSTKLHKHCNLAQCKQV